jgi:hypothetical protein
MPYQQHVRTFIQQHLGGIIQGNKLNNQADVEAKISQSIFTFVSLSTAPDWVKSFNDLSQLKSKNIPKPNRIDILQGSLHFLTHIVKMGGSEELKFKPYRVPGIRWLGTLNQEVIVS